MSQAFYDFAPFAASASVPLRLGAALVLAWGACLLVLKVAQRAGGAHPMVNRSWAVVGTVIAAMALWAAVLCGVCVIAGTGVAELPFLPCALTLLLAGAAVGVTLLAAIRGKGVQRLLGAAAGGGCSMATISVWAEALHWAAPEWETGLACVAAASAGALLSQAALVWLMARWHHLRRDWPLGHTARAAMVLALLCVSPWAAFAAVLPAPSRTAAAPGLELLLAAMAFLLMGLAYKAERLERQFGDVRPKRPDGEPEPASLNDPVTGLLSRHGLEANLRRAAAQAESRGERIALLYIGLDGISPAGDLQVEALGEAGLQHVTQRLTTQASTLNLRHNPSENLARVGANEFVLMLPGPLDRKTVARAANWLLEILNGPIQGDDGGLQLSASIGVACFPEDGGVSTLIDRAGTAMRVAKAAGGSTYTCFEQRMQDNAADRKELLRDLRHAVEKQELELFYQPKIDARSGQVTAAEALLRWHHPTRGTILPSVFIPLAERHGLICALGNWVIEDACRQARVWRERGLKMRLAINLSAFQMRQNDLVERIQAALKRHGVNPSRLTCEITESVAMEDTQVTQRTFERLGLAGIHLSIDDFGTGYSSLSYLRRLPATELKIDRSFVMDLEASADARAIVDAVVKLAHAIGLKVVAEGVETVKQRDILLELGCDEFQGYLFARPMSARALMLWAVDDKPARHAFRPSLFAETNTPTMHDGARSTHQSVQPLRARAVAAKGN